MPIHPSRIMPKDLYNGFTLDQRKMLNMVNHFRKDLPFALDTAQQKYQKCVQKDLGELPTLDTLESYVFNRARMNITGKLIEALKIVQRQHQK